MKNESIFKEAMKGVKRLNKSVKVAAPKRRLNRKSKIDIDSSHKTHDLLFEIEVTTQPEESLFYAIPSLPYRVIKRLKKGDFPIEAKLDLHGKQTGEASYLLDSFLENAFEQGKRHLLIVHGKGSCKIKSAVDKWLKESPLVLGFSSARPDHGGTGALYLLIKKCRS